MLSMWSGLCEKNEEKGSQKALFTSQGLQPVDEITVSLATRRGYGH